MENVRRCWLGAAAVLVCATSSAAENARAEFPFRLYQDHLIVVKGTIGESEKADFLVDTGCAQTLIDVKIARKLRLNLEGEVELESFRNGEARQVTVPELRFGPVLVRSVRVLAADLSNLSWSGTAIGAVIGLDVLRRSSFSVDYGSRRITLGPVADSPSNAAFQAVSPILTVDLAVGSRVARLMVDTGAPRLTLFPNRMQSRLPGFLLRGVRTVQSPGGMSQFRDVELAVVRLGPTEWRHVPAFLMDAPELSYTSLDGVLAPSSLAIKSIDFDFERNRLSWKRQ